MCFSNYFYLIYLNIDILSYLKHYSEFLEITKAHEEFSATGRRL
jgi:hypothetical protein